MKLISFFDFVRNIFHRYGHALMAPENDLVSIIIPTYNQAAFLREALKCVLAQTWTNWEVIVVNNFSTDETAAVAKSFDDARIRLIDFRNNGIIAASRNLGIKESRGAYIAFLDSDDLWEKNKLNACIKKLKEGYGLVCHGEYHFVDGSSDRKPVIYGPEEDTSYYRLLAKGNCLSTSAIVVRRAVLEKVGSFEVISEINTAEDFDLWLRLSKSNCRMAILRDMLGSYRLHPASASASQLRNSKASLKVIEKHYKGISWGAGRCSKLAIWIRIQRVKLFIYRSNEARG